VYVDRIQIGHGDDTDNKGRDSDKDVGLGYGAHLDRVWSMGHRGWGVCVWLGSQDDQDSIVAIQKAVDVGVSAG